MVLETSFLCPRLGCLAGEAMAHPRRSSHRHRCLACSIFTRSTWIVCTPPSHTRGQAGQPDRSLTRARHPQTLTLTCAPMYRPAPTQGTKIACICHARHYFSGEWKSAGRCRRSSWLNEPITVEC
ncbi:hypothetical protein BDZ89DRAFT_581278 [Hymenopellis radicata]|nr:hypothetical protein BDZ89DRAFT_581278 [Hymenopellis radicata]